MSGVNKVILLGYLGKDPEVRYQPSGTAIANMSLATSETYKDRDGNKQERTEWHRVVLFGRIAEVAGEYLRKGSMAYIEGRLQTRKWTDKEGQERYTTEVVADRLQLVSSRRSGEEGDVTHARTAGRGSAQQPSSRSGGGGGYSGGMGPMDGMSDGFDDDVPFIVPADLPPRRRVRF